MARGVPKSGQNRGWFKPWVAQVKTESHRRAISEAQHRAWKRGRKNGGERPIGTTYLDRHHGYVRVKIGEGAGRWAIQHVVVMEGALGRKLQRGEIVHHIDGDRANNAIENLYLCRNYAHHMQVERQLKETFRKMLKDGKVTFSHALGIYACH